VQGRTFASARPNALKQWQDTVSVNARAARRENLLNLFVTSAVFVGQIIEFGNAGQVTKTQLPQALKPKIGAPVIARTSNMRRWPAIYNTLEIQMKSSQLFASSLQNSFARESATANFSEVQQFRALIRSFSSLSGPFDVEEYHGPKHQVLFNGQGAWGRSPARCELCDVLILAYSLNRGFRGRITFLQAKLSKDKHTNLCKGWPYLTDIEEFKGNLEQWDLLSRRPDILPVPPFKVHPQLLRGSLLPSVGSFGVFHKNALGSIDFFYSSADVLSVVGAPTTKQGKLTTSPNPRQRITDGLLETTFCCCLSTFGEALYNLEIGTPIEPHPTGVGSNDSGSVLRSWIRNVLSFYIEVAERDSILARQLRELLETQEEQDDGFPNSIPSLILIRSDASTPENSDFSIQRNL
jgi:hypothetical protein